MADSLHPARCPRRCAPLLLLLASLLMADAALAQAPPRGAAPPPPPPVLEPLPEIASDPELEPQVTITRKEGDTIEEARVQGRIVWIKVTPRHGRAYFLIPDANGQTYIRRDNFDSGLKVPLWLLFTF
jgi:hypothetical protein